jgi:hypothetical protein
MKNPSVRQRKPTRTEFFRKIGGKRTFDVPRPLYNHFYNHRGTSEQYIKVGKGAVKWTRLSCRFLAANAVRLQLHAMAYNLGISCGRWQCRRGRSRGR